MRWPRFAALVLVTFLLQGTLANIIAVSRFNISPDLLLILMIFFAIHCNVSDAIISSFSIGFAADIIAAGFPMGPRLISFGLFGTGLAYLHHVIAIRKIPYQAVAIFVVGIGTGELARLLAHLAGRSSGLAGWTSLAGTSIYSAVIGPFLFLLLGRLMNIKSPRRGRDKL